MRLITLIEATHPVVQKAIDPALMTFQEYRELVDPDQKFHPSTAYDSSMADLNKYADADKYDTLVNTIKRNGLQFEVRRYTRDKWDAKYTKTDQDGNVVYGEDGRALFMDLDDIKVMIPETQRFQHEFAIIEKAEGNIVGNTQDEWGTLLVRVAQEYRNFGFGTLLVKLVREQQPDRQSGGFTQAGFNNFLRVWSEMVREYMASGFYSHLVRQGHITTAKVKEIMAVVEPKKRHTQKNYDTRDPKDWLLMTDEQSFAVLYDKKIYDWDDPDDIDLQYWIDKHIIGIADLASVGGQYVPWVNRLHGMNDKIKGFLLSVLLWQEVGNPIRMEPEELQLASAYMGQGVIKQSPKDDDQRYDQYYVEESDDSWKMMAQKERMVRKKIDPYDEWYTRIISWAESLG